MLLYRGLFEQSVSVKRSAGTPFNEDHVRVVLGKFSELESRIEKTITKAEWEKIEDEAEILYRPRAYVCSLPEIPLQGANILSNMEQWTLPVTALDIIKKEVVPELRSNDLQKARAALFTLLQGQHRIVLPLCQGSLILIYLRTYKKNPGSPSTQHPPEGQHPRDHIPTHPPEFPRMHCTDNPATGKKDLCKRSVH